MKTMIFLAASLMAFNAHALLKSYNGKLSLKDGNYSCTFINKTNDTLDFKWVSYTVDRGYKLQEPYEIRDLINHRVRSGEGVRTIAAIPVRHKAMSCQFLAR